MRDLKATRLEIFSWCMFDFANSSYTTIIITAVYSAFFVAGIAGGGTRGDFIWALTLSVSYALVVLISPVLGAIADFSASQKRFLVYSYLSCVLTTSLLFFARSGNIYWAMVFLVLSNLAFSVSENLISSFLPSISNKNNIGKISGYGWSLGYIGGLFSLLLCLLFLEHFKLAGHYQEWSLRATCLITAFFFFITGLPTMLWLRQRGTGKVLPEGSNYINIGFSRLYQTFRQIRRYREMFLFMFSYLFYYSGIATVISFAAIFAQGELGFNQGRLILLIAVANITSAVGAFLFGFLQDRVGAKTTLLVTLFLWFVTVVWAYFVKSQAGFWGVVNLAGICIGASQSSSRALVGLFAPKEKQAEFYGFWGFFGKLAAIIGIFSFGFLADLTGSRRIAIGSTGVFFLIGIITLSIVNERRGMAAAEKTVT